MPLWGREEREMLIYNQYIGAFLLRENTNFLTFIFLANCRFQALYFEG